MTQQVHPALPRRLIAMLYDTLLVLPLIMLSVAISLGLYGALLKLTGGSLDALSLNPHLVQAIAFLTCVGFFSAFWLKSGQTLGMQAWRIKLISSNDGETANSRQALVRCGGALLSAACLGLGYLWCLVDRNHRYWHDYLSGTELILLPKLDKTKARDSGNDGSNEDSK
ncbi:MAG: RDD family protein [Halioglobus sp.]